MKKFLLHWLNGKTEEVEGDTLIEACDLCGVERAELLNLDFYEEPIMRTYFITVHQHAAAMAVDPNAVLVRTLPATTLCISYCCREASTHQVLEAFIYQVQVERRRLAEHAKGVIKCRAKEPEHYKTSLHSREC